MIVDAAGWVTATAPVPPLTVAWASATPDPSQVCASAGQATAEFSAKVPLPHVYVVVALVPASP